MSIAKDFRSLTKQLDDMIGAAFELDHGPKRKRPKTSRARLGTGLTKLEQKTLVSLRGTLHPSVLELAAVAAGAVWPHMPVRTFLSRLDLLGRYPKALARQERLSGHAIDGLLLATSGHMAYLAARGAALELFIGGKRKRFASVKAFFAFIDNDIEERAEWVKDALKAKSKAAARSKRIGDDVLEADAELVDSIEDPPSPRSPASRAFVALRTLRMYGPEGELADVFVNEGVAPYLEAARFAKLGALAAELQRLMRALSGKTFAARNRQMDKDAAAAALEDLEGWLEVHEDELTHALAKIAKPWGR